ncbi:MAG: methionine--tRNA ligase [Thermostichales cyanobacterium GMQP_bins_62]
MRDFSISRLNVSWGIPVPRDPEQTIYVWFDALINYLSALLAPGDEPRLEVALQRGWPASLHLVGKDIVRFHAIYWPAMLMSAGLPLPKRIFGHGFLTKDGQKMGKSLGNTLDPWQLVNQYGRDAVRYYFLKEIELGKDGDFSEARFRDLLNADLANDLGNLLNRSLNMLKKYRDYSIPEVTIPPDHPLKVLAEQVIPMAEAAYEIPNFTQAAEAALTLVRSSNKYLDSEAPWTKFKQGEQQQVEMILYAVLESVRIAALILAPITPELSLTIWRQLGYGVLTFADLHWQDITWGSLAAGQVPQAPQPVFQRLG